jgi:hypothetical protein
VLGPKVFKCRNNMTLTARLKTCTHFLKGRHMEIRRYRSLRFPSTKGRSYRLLSLLSRTSMAPATNFKRNFMDMVCRGLYSVWIALLCHSAYGLFTADSSTTLHYVSDKQGARCMDGSAPAYYMRRGHGSGSRKWILHFEGGGWCYDLHQCYLRSRSEYGSSRSLPAHQASILYFSGEESINPLMYNWNTVYIEYCDGSTFAGDSVQHYLVRACT